MNRDPITERGGANLYTYCYQSPLNYIDPNGKAPVALILLLGLLFIPGDAAFPPSSINDLAFDLIGYFYFGDGTTQYYLDSDYGNAAQGMAGVQHTQGMIIESEMDDALCRDGRTTVHNPGLRKRLYGHNWLDPVMNFIPAIAAINDVDLQLIYMCHPSGQPCCYNCEMVWSIADRFDANIDQNDFHGWNDYIGIFGHEQLLGIDYIDPQAQNILGSSMLFSIATAHAFNWYLSWEEEKEICCDPTSCTE